MRGEHEFPLVTKDNGSLTFGLRYCSETNRVGRKEVGTEDDDGDWGSKETGITVPGGETRKREREGTW